MLFEETTEIGKRVNVIQPARPERDRPIFVGNDWWEEIIRMVKGFVGDHMAAVIVDKRVAELFPDRIEMWHQELPRVRRLEIQGGEEAKTIETFVEIQKFLLQNEVHRDDIVISIGGGSISDVVGFAAATFTRGISWINIPTTLISMIDCAIGGKTSINLENNKNYCGVFYWPNSLLIDLSFLGTLSERHFRSGVAEMIKLGLIGDGKLFDLLCEKCNASDGADGIRPYLEEWMVPMVALKSNISSADPFQRGIRKVLLTGHVTAHALEGASRLHLHHGEAVAIGLAFESFIAEKRGLIDPQDRRKLVDLLENCNLPTALPAELHDSTLVDYMRREKRNRGRSVNFVLPYKPGLAVEDWPEPNHQLTLDEIWSELATYRKTCS